MRNVSSIAVSTAVICLAGCASPSLITLSSPVGPAPTEPAKKASVGSSLQVYSARITVPIDVNREEFLWNNDFGRNDFLYGVMPSDYTICTRDDKVLERVHNAGKGNDPEPAVVPLPPGIYEVRAEARDFGLVTVPVVIETGKRTRVNLQRGHNPFVESVARTNAVFLGGYRIVGWQAKNSPWADPQ